eukprot:9036046-Alexandrium_andersonii.AAC.1
MSASLVGSEMCIRDSPTPSPSQLLWTTPARGPRSAARRLRSQHAQRPKCCLLYTSDAADDM